ncbi:MAG TPA: MauE/DoxX family redox-associated membrane protein [Ktedonosporobacter sp.]|nr:MauE/DoxX family redox-associated membrane protein [Ktedonosporobacter sp.]
MIIPNSIALFCQLFLLLIFAFSAARKGSDMHAFASNIKGFALLPSALVDPAAWLFAGAEVVSAGLLLASLFFPQLAVLQLGGLGLSLVLLLVFSAALIWVLARRLNVPCGCFGTTDRPVSRLDLLRNAGLMGCAVVALVCMTIAGSSPPRPPLALLLLGLQAAACGLIWTHLDEIVSLFDAG